MKTIKKSIIPKYSARCIGWAIAIVVVMALGCSKSPSTTKEATAADTSGMMNLRVATFNIHHANPPGQPGVINVEAVAAAIQAMDVDLIALQEVDANTRRSGVELHQAKKLAELTDMYVVFSKSMDYDGGAYGNAVLSRFPVVDSAAYHLPVDPDIGGEPRSVAAATVQLPDSSTLIFASTHLGYKSDTNRLLQVNQIQKAFAKPTMPVILAGDLNMEVGAAAMDSLEILFYRPCGNDCAPTIPVENPEKAIDFILVQPQKAFKTVSYQVQMDITVSDHLPVVAAFELQPTD